MRPRKRSVPLAPAPETALVALDPALAYLGAPEDREAIAAACVELHLDVVAVADDGALDLALEAVANGPASCLVVRRLGDLADHNDGLASVLDRIDADGIRLVALDVGLDTAAPAGRMALRRRPRRREAPWLRAVEDPAPPAPEAPPLAAPEPEPQAPPVAEATPPSDDAPLAPTLEPAPVADAPPVVVPAPPVAPLPVAAIAPPARSTKPLSTVGYASATGSKDGAAAAMCAQREAIASHCGEQIDLDLLELVGDRESTKDRKALDRPGLSHTLQRIAAGEVDCLVVCGLDHLSRSVAELGQLLRWLDHMDVRLVALDLDLDTATESGRTTTRALAAVSQWERERISERTKAGLAAARAKRHSGSSVTAQRTALLHQRIAAMRADGMTLQAIADVLNAEGIPTQRGGAKWRPSSVQSAAGYKRPQRARSASRLPDAVAVAAPTASVT